MTEVNKEVIIRCAEASEAETLYQLITEDEKWTETNGPYFGYQRPSFEKFQQSWLPSWIEGIGAKVIEYQGRVVGVVTWYWECENTRWLEAGIVIHDSSVWGQGVARRALIPWINEIFNHQEIERVGMTTWSGNPGMIKSAQAIGLQVEGVIRKVRYYQGTYYDSVKLGILREEWQQLHG